jgi:imidazolonepropionase-like amidohydrolase
MANLTAIINGKVLTVTKGTIDNGVVLISGDKIHAVGRDVNVPDNTRIINANGGWILPGLIDCHTHISTFNEPRNLRGLAVDGNESSYPITPHVRALDALNPFDPAIEKVRSAGFTTVYTTPGSGNLIGGTGIALKLRGKRAEEMVIPGTEQMKMALGENPKNAYGTDRKAPVTRMGSAAMIRQTLFEARNYADKLDKLDNDQDDSFEYDFKLASLIKVVRGEQRVRIHSHRADDICTAIRIAEEFNLDFAIEHATEGYLIKEYLAEKNVTCVVGPLLLGPIKQEVWGLKLENPGLLTDAGVKVCLTADEGSKTIWLPMEVGLLVRRGLSEEDAIKGITIYPAELLGLADRVGSIEVGKDADLTIYDGHPLSNMSLCRLTIIDGVIYHNTLDE